MLRRRRGRGAKEFHGSTGALLGMGHDDLTALVLDVCGDEPFDSYEEQPSVLPQPDLTPGEFDADFDLAAACGAGAAAPPIPADVTTAVLASYDATAEDVDVQRLIPFSLGGTTTPANLFPVPIDAHPGAGDKPEVDALVASLVCNGTVTVEVARASIIDDWPLAYARLRR